MDNFNEVDFKCFIIDLFKLEEKEDELYYQFRDQSRILITDPKEYIHILNEIESDDMTVFYKNKKNESVAEMATYRERWNVNGPDEKDVKVDEINGLEYIREDPSKQYVFWMYKRLYEELGPSWKENNRNLNRVRQRIRHQIRKMVEDIKELPLIDLLKMPIIPIQTLKVSGESMSKGNAKKFLESFTYTYMRNLGRSIKVYDIQDIFPIIRSPLRSNSGNLDFEAPKRTYNSILIDYYNLALSTPDPFVAFISYYHIIEYFYDEVFKEYQINYIRDKITSSTFSYKDDDKLNKLATGIIGLNRQAREDGGGNELQTLKFVLKKYITEEERLLENVLKEDQLFYQENTVSFSKGTKIIWNKDLDKTLSNISKRIYFTRNSLVHSKSARIDEIYHPYEHKGLLTKEIPLIKAIAEIIIEDSSEII